MSTIKDLIQSIKDGTDYNETFINVWTDMVANKIAELKGDIAANMFKNEVSDDSDGTDSLDEAVSPEEAHRFLAANGMGEKDYHEGSSDYKERLIALARKHKYRKSGTSPGSLSRAFHSHLTKQAKKYLKDAKAN